MNPLQQNIHAYIRLDEEESYVAECMEIAVVTQGKTLDEVSQNLVEAVSLHLDGEDPAEFGLVAQPALAAVLG
ncbi:type II toxin-antitoxin system HicB family antitoxin [Acaryochloris sp. IP29b_bin.148]|uniref:type II toxin-antitoxin system HicB family antitoxin n=1 Tax=Acaryochloris sp. IP29b_bin.148 TaxID=2969218 RepID=UPI00261BE1D3|nr:type II toxin-antitoxin system HicB family antitoxin [Acaryochloris sp. IP29b_bin.148]